MSVGIMFAGLALALIHVREVCRAVGPWVETGRWPRGMWWLSVQAVIAWHFLEAGRITGETVFIVLGAIWAGAATWVLSGRIDRSVRHG